MKSLWRPLALALAISIAGARTAAATCTAAAGAPLPAAEAKRSETVPRRVVRALAHEAFRYGTDSIALVKAPLSWQARDWRKAAGVALVLGGLFAADRRIDGSVQRHRNANTDDLSSATTRFGGQVSVDLSLGLLAGGLVFRDDNVRDMGREALEAGFLAGLLGKYVLKPAFGRKRPYATGGQTELDPFSHNDSFPSGHATQAFAVASVVAMRAHGWVAPTIAYTLASIVSFDRVNDHVHFTSDVVAGAALGIATGRFLVARHRRERSGQEPGATIEIVPMGRGIAARIDF